MLDLYLFYTHAFLLPASFVQSVPPHWWELGEPPRNLEKGCEEEIEKWEALHLLQDVNDDYDDILATRYILTCVAWLTCSATVPKVVHDFMVV